VLITRKGAVRVRATWESFRAAWERVRTSCAARVIQESFAVMGAGRAMSRAEARRRFTLDDHSRATAGVECRKHADVIDETPLADQSIDAVMEARRDLVDVVHTLRQLSA